MRSITEKALMDTLFDLPDVRPPKHFVPFLWPFLNRFLSSFTPMQSKDVSAVVLTAAAVRGDEAPVLLGGSRTIEEYLKTCPDSMDTVAEAAAL